jgi:hypothetical protein
VATTLYRLFTSVLAVRLREWQESVSGSMPLDCQFAFRPHHGVEHSHLTMMIARDSAISLGRPLVLVSLDIDKAYDTVVWDTMWRTLANLGLPDFFIRMAQNLYSQTQYVVAANATTSQPFYCTMGLLQGCALSPMLYNLYLVPVLSWLHTLCVRDGLGVSLGDTLCPFTGYADDLLGMLTDPSHVPQFLAHVSAALSAVNQHINFDKTRVMVVGPSDPIPSSIAGVSCVGQLKVLGVWLDAAGSLAFNVQHRFQVGSSKLALAIRRLADAGCRHNLRIATLILNADVRPTLLFGACMWGMHGLKSSDPVKHLLQRPYSTLIRRVLGLPASTAHWIALLLAGQWPVQFYIVREFMLAWNRFVSTSNSNPLVLAAVTTASEMFSANIHCWLWEWCRALQRCVPDAAYQHIHQSLSSLRPIDHSMVTACVQQSYMDLLASFGDPLVEFCPKRRIATTYRLMVLGSLGRRVRSVSWDVPPIVRATWYQFLACSSAIPVHDLSGVKPFTQRLCTKCTHLAVANETHILFHCVATQATRQQFLNVLDWSHAPALGAFLDDNAPDICAWFVFSALKQYCAPQCGARSHGQSSLPGVLSTRSMGFAGSGP